MAKTAWDIHLRERSGIMATIQRGPVGRVKSSERWQEPRATPPALDRSSAFPPNAIRGSVPSMKLRISGSTVCFRLVPPEVSEWRTAGRCDAEVRIGPAPQDRWAYRLELTDSPDWTVATEAGRLLVGVPRATVQAWSDSEDAISLEHLTPWGTRIVVEKDLPRRVLRAKDPGLR